MMLEIKGLSLSLSLWRFSLEGSSLFCFLSQTLTRTIERIPTISTQLKIVATVKATMIGANGKYQFVCIHHHAKKDGSIHD